MSKHLPIDPELQAEVDHAAVSSPWVGRCVATDHPTLIGRVKVSWSLAGKAEETWVPTLMHLTVRVDDHVLLSRPANWPEPIVVGVVDGFAKRPSKPLTPAPSVRLEADETVAFVDARDRPLFDVHADADGVPKLRIRNPSLSVEIEGHLRLAAASVEIEGTQGQVDVTASEDVVVQGRTVHLN